MKDVDIGLFNQITEKSEEIFLEPKIAYTYDEIINGCNVLNPLGGYKTMYAVGSNTWRAFYKKETSIIGPKDIFINCFTKNKDNSIKNLKGVNKINELNELEDDLCKDLKEMLKPYIKENMLQSFNKIRKPIDLYIEHIVLMSKELEGYREKLVPMLFLPLDSQILASEHIFTDSQLYKYNLKRSSSFKDITSSRTYNELQMILQNKSLEISKAINKNFNRIYFDLLWNDRYKKPGSNLFETNFKSK